MPPYRTRARWTTYLTSIGLFALVAAAALLLTRGYDVDLQTGQVSQKGLLAINSVPDKAFITINNEVNGDRTDTRIKLDPGSYAVKVDRPGVIPWEKRIDIEPGEAVLEEDILLFSKEPKPRQLSAGPVSAAAIAPNGRDAAWLVALPAGTEVWTGSVLEGEPQKKAVLPPAYGQPTALQFSPDGARLLVAHAGESSLVATSTGQVQAIPAGGSVRLLSGRDGEIVTQQGAALLRVSAAGPTALADGVGAWTTTDSGIYASTPAGLVRIDQRTDQHKTLPLPAPLAGLRGAGSGDILFGMTTAGTLLRWEGDRVETVAENVQQFAAPGSGALVAYLSGGELHLWDRDKRESKLVTRFGAPVDEISLLPDGHYLMYRQGSELHLIAADGSNDQVVANLGAMGLSLADKVSVLSLDPATRTLATIRLLND